MKEVTVKVQGDLVVPQATLGEAGLSGRLRLIVQPGEIRILPEPTSEAEDVVQELAGCLGHEPATAYDFHFKLGSLKELRQLSRDEEAHVEQEFADYDQLYPRE